MYTNPTLTPSIKSIIFNNIIMTRLRFQLEEILRYNFAYITNFPVLVKLKVHDLLNIQC